MMKYPIFSCNSKYYYDISSFPVSDDEELEEFLDSRKEKNELHYLFEKAVNKIIVDTKKSCDVSSDFEEIEKIENKKNESFDSDCLDDIDIILKKSKCENMFLKKIKNNNDIIFPPNNIKHRIYSVNEEQGKTKDNKKDNIQKDKIIENFKDVLCNDLNKYFKDILENVKENNEIHTQDRKNTNNDLYILSDKKEANNFDVIKNNTKNDDTENYFVNNCSNRENIKNRYYNNINSDDKIYHGNEILKIDMDKSKRDIIKKVKINNINPDINMERNKNDLSKRRTYKKNKKTYKKSQKNKIYHFSKKKVLNAENEIYPYGFNNCYNLKNNKLKVGNNNQNIETLNYSNISANLLICDNDKLNTFKNLKSYVETKDNSNKGSNEDFTFNHFQKNANNNILNKLLF